MKKQATRHHKNSIAKPKQVNKTSIGNAQKTLENLFGIDARSLAVFRIAIGVLLLVDLAIRATDLNVMYTDGGMFSRAVICRYYTSVWNWSFHFGGGSLEFQAVLFGIDAVLALMLVAGFQTRLAGIGSWLMLASIQHRVPPILSGAEILLRMLVFWAMFLPLGKVWSVDRWRQERRDDTTDASESRVLSIATAAILLQMGMMYLFSAILKSNTVWWRGEAMAGILAHDFYASPIAQDLLQFPRLLKGMTWGAFALEWLAPLLLFFPKRTGSVRLGIVAALALMHVAIGLCMEVGLFSYVAMAGLTLFLPPKLWNSLLPKQPLARTSQFVFQRQATRQARLSVTWITQGLCLFALLAVVAINIDGLRSHPSLHNNEWKALTLGCGLGQRWGMFETIPANSGWYVALAKLNDGSQVDLLRQGAAVDWRRPKFPAGIYPNHFWQKLFVQMTYVDDFGMQVFREPVAEFLCRKWNAGKAKQKQIAQFEFLLCTEEKESEPPATPARRIVCEALVHLDLGRR